MEMFKTIKNLVRIDKATVPIGRRVKNQRTRYLPKELKTTKKS